MPICAECGKDIEILDKVFRRDSCPECNCDLHTCIQCSFYKPGYNNDCLETQAERVVDKDRANFCDYYVFGTNVEAEKKEGDAKKMLEDLFK